MLGVRCQLARAFELDGSIGAGPGAVSERQRSPEAAAGASRLGELRLSANGHEPLFEDVYFEEASGITIVSMYA